MQIQIIPIPAFKDNYIWLVHNGNAGVVIDPGDAQPVISYLKQMGLNLSTILITHHHHDHTGGVTDLLSAYPESQVFAPKLEAFDFIHQSVSEGDRVILPELELVLEVLDLPGHTLGHVAYFSQLANDSPILFCGDTLFGAGCGRLFEGTPAQMLTSLKKLAALPTQTRVYCTHEYTLHNINFALGLEPNNQDLLNRHQSTIAQRNQLLPSLPTTIGLELATNPFLRGHSQEIQKTLGIKDASELEVFSITREMRNHY